MKLAIMQPYFFPYLGYFQLINAVDIFVVYDNIEYTKKGWINRNRYLLNGKDEIFSIAIKKDNDFLNVNKRVISSDFIRQKLLAKFANAYAKAPYKQEIIPLLDNIIKYDDDNLFGYIFNSICEICQYLNLSTKIIISSSINIDHKNLKGQNKVIGICKTLCASNYINPIGGQSLYDKQEFTNHNIQLNFIKMNDIKYKQFDNEFVPSLSIIDVLMFNGKTKVKELLKRYDLV